MYDEVSVPTLLVTLLERLMGQESSDLEVKAAHGGLPRDIWPTISAFANTRGGWLVLGVEEIAGSYRLTGVPDAPIVLQTFHNQQRNPQKISFAPCDVSDASMEPLEGQKALIVIRVPAAPRRYRPVYINGNPYGGTYLRRGSGDFQATKQEVDRMMREASDVSADTTILEDFGLNDIEAMSLASYRRRFQTQRPAAPENNYDDLTFLKNIGGFARDRRSGHEGLTVAGLLMFGRPACIREWRHLHLIDFQRVPVAGQLDQDWHDRLLWEGNLFDAFSVIYPRLVVDQPVPFQLEGGTRLDDSAMHVVLREALVNLLVHADYAETQASLVLRADDGFVFRNPGSSRVLEEDLLTGHRSDPRNPTLVRMFRLIGWAEEAGSGIPRIFRSWRDLGFQLPLIDVGAERYEFTLSLRPSHLLSDEDRNWLSRLGDRWTEAEQLALVIARHDDDVDNLKLRRLTGQHSADASRVLVGLRNRGLLNMIGGGRAARYQLHGVAAEFLEQAVLPGITTTEPQSTMLEPDGMTWDLDGSDPNLEGSNQSLESLPSNLEGLTEFSLDLQTLLWRTGEPARQRSYLDMKTRDEILATLCAIAPLSIRQIATIVDRSETYLREPLRKLVADGRIAFLFPQSPNHPKQKYTMSAH